MVRAFFAYLLFCLLANFATAQNNYELNGNVCYGSYEPAKALALAETEIVHIFGIFDSNGLHSGHGWDDGWQWALLNKTNPFRMWATGAIATNNHYRSNVAYGHTWGTMGALGDRSGEIAAHSGYIGPAETFHPVVIDDGETITSTAGGASGLQIGTDHPNASEIWRYEVAYGTFDNTPAGAATFRMAARQKFSPYEVLGQATSATSCKTGTNGLAFATFDLPASTKTQTTQIGFKIPSVSNCVGPLFFAWNRVIFPAFNRGFSFTSYYALGGQSARDSAFVLQTDHRAGFFTEYFGRLRLDSTSAGQTPKVIVMINMGHNDKNETLQSVGPAQITDADSGIAYADNIKAHIEEFETRWTDNGWPLSELTFIVIPSHVTATPQDGELDLYLLASKRLADELERVVVVDPSALHLHSAYTANSGEWLDAGTDVVHLSRTGHQQVALAMLNAILDYAASEPTVTPASPPRFIVTGGTLELAIAP